MTFGSIYKIQFPNGKHYIGLTTTSLEKRHYEHKFFAKNGDAKYLLYKALNKYDMIDNFELIEIDTGNTLEELYKKEIDYIIQYNSYYINGNGYNMTYGGDGTHGYVYTEENKQKMSESQIKRFENDYSALTNTNQKISRIVRELDRITVINFSIPILENQRLNRKTNLETVRTNLEIQAIKDRAIALATEA